WCVVASPPPHPATLRPRHDYGPYCPAGLRSPGGSIMDTAVALVGAYLRFNGYISLPEQPILVGEGRPWRYHTATDLDLLAVRFPYAAVVVPRNGGGPPWEDEDLTFGVDPMLDLQEGVVDVLVAEVKEGRPRLNEALRDPIILEAALSRLNAGFDDPMERI